MQVLGNGIVRNTEVKEKQREKITQQKIIKR